VSAVDRQADGTLIQAATYAYDALGDRIQESVTANGVTTVTNYAFDATGNVWADLDGNNGEALETRRLFLSAADQVFARIGASGNPAWYLTDHQGSVQEIVDDAGAVLDHLAYDANGNVTNETNPAQGDRYRFQGMQWDFVVRQDVAWGRNFDPLTGRWTNVDPSGLRPDSNPFRFVGNGPTNGTDPSGLAPGYWTDYIPIYPVFEVIGTLGWEQPKLAREGRLLDATRQALWEDNQKTNPDATIVHTGNGDPAEEELNRMSARSRGFAGQLGTHWGQSYHVAGVMAGALTREMIRSVGEKAAQEIFTNYAAGRVPEFLEFLQAVKGWKVLKNSDKIERLVTAEGKELTKDVLEAAAKEFKAGPIKTQWGWSRSNSWFAAVKEVASGGEGGILRTVKGKVPTYAEAKQLIEAAGGTIVREEGPHAAEGVAGHIDFNHINFTTASGVRSHLAIQALPQDAP